MDSNDFSSFGAVLKAFRTRRRLTQQQLAEALGVHRSAIVRWEQGDYLPESKAMVLELARHLRLDDYESRQLLEASLTALAPSFLVPLPRNPFFTGREEILEVLHRHLRVEQAVTITQSSALHGLGGVGKTQIALEYAYRYALEYSAVFWIGAETEEGVVASLLRIAETLQLPGRDDNDPQRVIALVQRWLSAHGQWLVIWDNVEDLTLLDRFLPTARSGALLLTTRRQALGTLAHGVDLAPMEQEEGILFLLRRAELLKPEATCEHLGQFAGQTPAQYQAVSELVTILGGLPLALDQAGAYLEETRCGLHTYLERFRTRRAMLLQQRGGISRDHPASVSTTFSLAITVTAECHPAVRDLLRVCALLQPDAIPEELFRQGAEYLGPQLQAACSDPLEWDRLVGVVCSYSLLSRQPEGQTLSLHRLVQAVLLDTMTDAEREQWNRRVIKAFDMIFPEVQPESEYSARKLGERLLPHALLCLHRAGTSEAISVVGFLAYKMALYLYACGQYAEAELLFRQALGIQEQNLGSAHPQIAETLRSLARLYRTTGKYTEAELLLQRALGIREQSLGPDHPLTTDLLNGLAGLFIHQGKYAEAEPLFQRALRNREQSSGPHHTGTAMLLSNLAVLYEVQGKYLEAEPLFQRALSIWEQALGPEHPDVAFPLNGLANICREQSRYIEAELLYQRILRVRERSLGPSHPLMVEPLNDLAELYRVQGKYTQAEPLFQRALRTGEEGLVSDHRNVALSFNGLANICRDQNRYAEAEALYQRALSICEQRLGPQHPEASQTLHDLVILRQKQGNMSEATSLAKRALTIRSQALGDAHPKTIATRTLYAQLLQEQAAGAEKTAVEQEGEVRAGACNETRQADKALLSPHKGVDVSFSTSDPLQAFLDARCERHPRAWCRSADLWQAYVCWVEEQQEPFPLTRRAFAVHLKAHGCRADHTHEARIWRGITVVKEER